MNIILWDYESVWQGIWPQNDVGHCDLYFMVQWFCLISWRLFYIRTPYFGIMSQHDQMFGLKINVGHCDLYFIGSVILPWKLFSSWTSYFGTMSQYDPLSDLKIFIGHCDLYFMVQWFCLISWRLIDVWTLYFVIMSQCNASFALKQCRSQWSIFSWSSDFAFYLK